MPCNVLDNAIKDMYYKGIMSEARMVNPNKLTEFDKSNEELKKAAKDLYGVKNQSLPFTIVDEGLRKEITGSSYRRDNIGNVLRAEPNMEFFNELQTNFDLIEIETDRLDYEKENILSTNEVKPGVSELFKSNPELTSIGTPEQYSQYLDTIFPDSKVKDIVYHSSINSDKQEFKKSTRVVGYYFATTPKEALQHAERQLSNPKDATLYKILLNLKNPRIISKVIDYEELDTEAGFTIDDDVFGFNADGIIAEQVEEYNTTYKRPESTWLEKQIIAFEPEQIHILGSKQDIKGFKEFLGKVDENVTEENEYNTSEYKAIQDFENLIESGEITQFCSR